MLSHRHVIGLAPSSSADGVAAALLQLEGVGLDLRVRLVSSLRQPYSRDLRLLVLRAASTAPVETRQVSLLHRLLGETFAAAARQVADRNSFSLTQVQCIGCLGQTVWQETEGRFPSTLELGTASVIAERTGLTTVSDFRARDVAARGLGVPVEALADYLLFRHPEECRLLLHLGGTATVVSVPPVGRVAEVMGFEAGPCNLLLDGLIRHLTGGRENYDTGGKQAVQGRCVEPLLERWIAHPYWQRRPPRSVSPQLFVTEFVTRASQLTPQYSLHDLLCTAAHLVARGIVSALQRYLPSRPERILLSGGGARNGLLWALLEQQLSGADFGRTESVGVPGEARRAMAYGLLAALTLDGVPANVPRVTGASGARLLGSVTPGSPANWARSLAWMAHQTALSGGRAA